MLPTIPGYVLERQLGEGGMGVVYLGRQHGSGQAVAVKILRHSAEKNQERLVRFEREVRALGALQHPNIVRLLDFGHLTRPPAEADGTQTVDVLPFMVMEYLPQVATLGTGRELPWILDRIDELLAALDYLHTRSAPLIHRDVKPQNLGLADDGRLILLDFGLVSMQGEAELTRLDSPMGTLAYAAPEQLDSSHTVDARTDLYAVGMVLLSMLVGKNPLQDLSVTDIFSLLLVRRLGLLEAMQDGRVAAALPSVSPALDAVLRKLLANHPSERYRTAREARDGLRRCRLEGQAEVAGAQALFGRNAILQRMQQLLEQAQDGAGRGVCLWGHQGSGKSHLLREIAAMARGFEVLWLDEPQDVTALSRRARTRPLLVCMDTPTVDEPFVDLASRSARGKRYLLICTASHVLAASNVLNVGVPDLSDDASRDMVVNRLGMGRADDVETVLGLCGTHAATLADVCDAVLARPQDSVSVAGQAWYRGRLQAMPEATREALAVAAILTPGFETDLLSAALGRPVDVEPASGFLHAHEADRFSFRCLLMAQAAAADLDRQQAMAIRLRALAWLEATCGPEEASRVLEMLVAILEVERPTGLEQRLATLALEEARRQVAVWRMPAVYALLTRVYDVLPWERPEKTTLAVYLAVTAALTGRPGEARHLASLVEPRLPELPPDLYAETLLWAGRVWLSLDDLSKAAAMVGDAKQRFSPSTPELWYRSHDILAQIFQAGGPVAEADAMACLEVCIALGQAGQVSTRQLGRSLSLKFELLRDAGRYAEAEQVVQQGLRLEGTPIDRGQWLYNQAFLAICYSEDLSEGATVAEEAARIHPRFGFHLGHLHVLQARFTMAEVTLKALVAAAEEESVRLLKASGHLGLGLSRWYQWQPVEAEACFLAADPLQGDASADIRHDVLFHLALTSLDRNDLVSTSSCLDQCAPLADRHVHRWEACWARALMALARRDVDEAERLAAELEDMHALELTRPVYREAMRAGVLARIAALRQRWSEFAEELDRARRLLGRLTFVAPRARLVADAALTVKGVADVPAQTLSFLRTCLADAIRDVSESPSAVRALQALMVAPDAVPAAALTHEEARRLLFPTDGAMPSHIGTYAVKARLGCGGMATVYRVENERGESYALKVPLAEVWDDAEYRKRFVRELQFARSLRHPNLVGLVEVHDGQGGFPYPYLVMDWIRGWPLCDIAYGSLCSISNAVSVGIQTLEALAYIHKHGVVHRDIKPGNLMVSNEGHVFVMDFGIAKDVQGVRLTKTGEALGTPLYMAPEQMVGTQVDGRADIYSLGTILFEMVAGRLPFTDQNWLRLSRAKTETEAPPIDTVCSVVDASLARCITGMLARRPEERFQTAGDALHALQKVRPEVRRLDMPKVDASLQDTMRQP